MLKQRSESVPPAMRSAFEAIIALTDSFCKQHLDEECAKLCRELAAALARKRPSPLGRGQPAVWAYGVIHALAMVNYLLDRSQKPYVSIEQLSAALGVNQTTGGSKSKQIRDMFKMRGFDPDWCLPSKMDRNPIAWMLQVNGLLVDARYAPREVQEIAYEKGLIPYIPADRQAS
jgi:hypothetical protein